jgi:hypothetical protein
MSTYHAMATHDMDLEKQPLATNQEITSTSPSKPQQDPLHVYQTLVGDVHAMNATSDDSLYHDIVAREKHAFLITLATGFLFAVLVATQIVLCLGIAIGAQTGFAMNTISILAGVNTAVAAGIAVLKGLGLPEKSIVERHKLRKLAERIRFTTRRLQAGLDVDAAQEAMDTLKAHDEVEDEAQVLPNVGDAAGPMPKKTEKE